MLREVLLHGRKRAVVLVSSKEARIVEFQSSGSCISFPDVLLHQRDSANPTSSCPPLRLRRACVNCVNLNLGQASIRFQTCRLDPPSASTKLKL